MRHILFMLQLLILHVLSQQQNFSLLLDSGHSKSFLKFLGDASQDVDHVELTSRNATNSAGRLYYTNAVHLRESCNPNKLLSFSTSFTFQIVVSASQTGDGMAFCITYGMPETPISGNGGGLGMVNRNADGDTMWLFAVEFDTFQNSEFNDPKEPHVGIDINSLDSVKRVVAPNNLALDMNYTLTAWVDYISASEEIQVRLSRTTTKPETALLSHVVSNLSDVIQDTMYLGFSAATGAYTELHRIYSWNFSVSNSSLPNCSADQPIVHKQSTLSLPVLVILITLSLYTCISLFAASWLWCKQKKRDAKHVLQSPITTFTYSQLRAATKNFSPHNLLGKGGFGSVYKGDLANGTVVAVKVLSQNTGENELQFVAELSVISHFRHKNLLSLRGWCHEKGKLLLIYDYMQNGSLEKHLFNSSCVLSWRQRYNIVLGVAEGLSFLHHGWEQKVVHRDIKASNVLLDINFVAHVGDFGLAKLLDCDKTEVEMTMLGTLGYIAPELVKLGMASEKSDVYSFGVLVLEVATGKKVIDLELGVQLVEWVWSKMEEHNILEVVDPKLETMFDKVELRTVLLLGLLCCQEDPHQRPSMRKCCNILKGDEALPSMAASDISFLKRPSTSTTSQAAPSSSS